MTMKAERSMGAKLARSAEPRSSATRRFTCS
jgi:hypothetical protein